MSLAPLLSFVYAKGTEEAIRRGKKIFHTAGVQLLDRSDLEDRVRFRVKNDQYNNFYTVSIQGFSDPDEMQVRCQCPYNMGDICRHEVAALLQLHDMVEGGFFDKVARTYDQSHTVVRLQQVNRQLLSLYTSKAALEEAVDAAMLGMALLKPAEGDTLKATVHTAEGEEFPVIIRQADARYYHTSCSCNETEYPLCVHKATVLLQALRLLGQQFFQQLQNYDAHKNKLLGIYGYSLADDLTGKFEFYYREGKPFLRLLDPTIKRVAIPTAAPGSAPSPVSAPTPAKALQSEASGGDTPPAQALPQPVLRTLAAVAQPDPKGPYPQLRWRLLSGLQDTDGQLQDIREENLELHLNPDHFVPGNEVLLAALRRLTPESLSQWVRKSFPFTSTGAEDGSLLPQKPEPEIREKLQEYLYQSWERLARALEGKPCYVLTKGAAIKEANLLSVSFSPDPAGISLNAVQDKAGVLLRMQWVLEGTGYELNQVETWNEGLIYFDGLIYRTASPELMRLAQDLLRGGSRKISAKAWPLFLAEEILPRYKQMPIHLAAGLTERLPAVRPRLRLYLAELEGQLTFSPAFVYGDVEASWAEAGDAIAARNGKLFIQPRDEQAEQEFLTTIQNLHTEMRRHERLHCYYMPASSVLAGNWFFHFIDAMREGKVEVLGQEGLRQLRIAPYRPRTSLRISSGIDWFDAELDLTYGDQRVSITEVKKALSQRQQYVPLADGSLGLLPEEWLKKHALLIKMGEAHGQSLRLKKNQVGVLDQLMEAVDETALADELELKKERLARAVDEESKTLEPPAGLEATLRPYQQSGYQWMSFLSDAGWGGLLADDMGLGKTIQALSIFLRIAQDDPEASFLVVCPTTLVYNWEAEAQKFTPSLTTLIHHGPKRATDKAAFDGIRIVITTYGTLRSDILLLRDIVWDAAVLDESQAIKNPTSQASKAALALKAKRRYALSGTPVQNNTFDLYAQLNFLNPGLLGSRDFFQNEFAMPIDKFGDTEVREQLRQLTHPFILRRSKEQVAKELPAKTEMVMYCEMGADQRRIYDAYRNDYRAELLGMIDTKGMERSQLHILQGLTKLRQICDSPAILNEDEKYPNHSVKLEELVREIEENIGQHKALIFSQFLGMLALIRGAVTKAGINYAYFDGSATTMQRNEAVRKFQNDESCRVFLISLKAGGIGLNLTAADYVYIVDPWWNPAVEQQAIDRTHRIGQTKNIVAYRMICKDTIEEKILQLQEKKKELAAGLITTDNALMKKLTRDDISFLLS